MCCSIWDKPTSSASTNFARSETNRRIDDLAMPAMHEPLEEFSVHVLPKEEMYMSLGALAQGVDACMSLGYMPMEVVHVVS